ncbi:hypothetical protein OHT57_06465 [Streptomyces sp. NBC_00285]|uniref:hypothetical protein n=1 Tax=Streptomyces sp. NBC_00285 TaxID=2975700 RepID=UPI002E29893B|nr:hypothetical protein [Streptomyces sp. NBC_00285]
MESSHSSSGELVTLTDDDLEGLSGGIPHFDSAFGGYQDVLPARPVLPILQDRPSDDPQLWF